MNNPSSFFSELKRRQIYRGGVMYIVAGWVIVQVATTVFPYFSIPAWAIRLLVVIILLGFPIALVCLWMFESHVDPEERLRDRRGGGESRDAVARLLEAERMARQRENQELIAALAELKGAQGQAAASPPSEFVASVEPAPEAPPMPSDNQSPDRAPAPRRSSMWFLTLIAVCLLASVAWQLLAPQPIQPIAVSGEIAQQLVAPGFRQVEGFAVRLIAPVLQKAGLGIAPQHVFHALLALIGLFVLRDFYRQFRELLTRRRARVQ
ncbi:MAG TPA: hypothetical protein VNS59_01480 [Lysobacter sp.]|nr:hypothetical protein [Lysobacter sp.]